MNRTIKKNLFCWSFFFTTGMLLDSPLVAMEDFDQDRARVNTASSSHSLQRKHMSQGEIESVITLSIRNVPTLFKAFERTEPFGFVWP